MITSFIRRTPAGLFCAISPAIESAVSTAWLGLPAPAGLPPALLARLNADIVAVLRSADVAVWCGDQGLGTLPSTPEEFARFMTSETDKFARVIREAKVTLD